MRLVLGFFACLLLSLPLAEPAEAKRFGGGGFTGKSYSVPTKPKPTPAQQAAPAEKKAAPAAAPTRSGMGGLMAGVLAGGLFGALLFGGAFEGIQLMDLVLLAGVIYLIYRFFFAGRQQAASASASSGGQYRVPVDQTSEPTASAQPEADTQGSDWRMTSSEISLPQWLDKAAFLEGAQGHFIRLQAAWDKADWTEIRSYCTDALFQELQQARGALPVEQVTEVVSVMADIVRCVEETDKVMISVHFYGWMREDGSNTVEFSELWHLTRKVGSGEADWFIEGIEQH